MGIFETVFIVRPGLSTQRVEELTKSYTELITENGGTIGGVEQWGLRSLAYMIKKNKRGYYVFIAHESPSKALDVLQYRLRINEDILRFLSVRVETMPTLPTAGMRRAYDPDRKRSDTRRSATGDEENNTDTSPPSVAGSHDGAQAMPISRPHHESPTQSENSPQAAS